ncbi:MAG: sulfate reduction electron transfer complex DsrMKJOP subunit DsrJ [Nitrospiraceae bacterium]|nr:sulfate reduction electron transfer complex DsrMKJOP subunit DsrJ [Nitrospiraceae bacterium]
MYNGGKIILGLAVFAGLVTFPFLYNIGQADRQPDLKLDTPVIRQMAVKHCVEPKAFMRAEHMQLLNDWRNEALRQGNREYVSSTGEKYNISLQNTCLHCHSNKKKFCDECHNYMAVHPYCFDCHLQPKENVQ